MKTTRYYLCLISILFLSSLLTSIKAQTDTLHLDYSGIQTVLPDTTEAKLNEWAKKINGKKYEVVVFAYYHDKDFKKFADERADDMFRILNRKAREWITIKTIESKKGKKFQRSRVDIVYTSLVPESKTEEVKKESTTTASKTSDEQKNKTSAKENKVVSKNKTEKENKQPITKTETVYTDSLKQQKSKTSGNEYYYTHEQIEAGSGGLVTRSDLEEIKKSKLIIALTGSTELDSFLVNNFKKFWGFTSDITFMKYQNAVSYAKTNENTVIFALSGTHSNSLAREDKVLSNLHGFKYRLISHGISVLIEKFKGKYPRTLIIQPIPVFSEEQIITPEALAFGITHMNYMLTIIQENDLNNSLKNRKYYKLHAPELKKSVLYIPDVWLHEKLDTSTISKFYTSPYKIVPYSTWANAILNKEDISYVIITPRPVGGSITFLHYIVNAKNGKTYGAFYSKNDNGTIKKRDIEEYEDISNAK